MSPPCNQPAFGALRDIEGVQFLREKLRHTNRISLCILVTFNSHKPCMNNLLPPPLGGSKGWGGHLWSTLVSNCCVTLGDGGSLPEPLSLYEGDGTSLHWLQVDPPQCLLSAIGSTLPVPTRVSKSLLGTALPRDSDLQLWWLPSSKQDGQWISSSENHFQVLLVSGKGCLQYIAQDNPELLIPLPCLLIAALVTD